MYYYKFPDYIYGNVGATDTNFLKAVPLSLSNAFNIDVCKKGSKQIILSGLANGQGTIYIYKFDEDTNGQMSVNQYSGAFWTDTNNSYVFDLQKPIRIIKYENQKPSLVAQIAKKASDNIVLFFSVRGSDDPNIPSYVQQIDIELFEAGEVPSSMVVDQTRNILFIAFGKKIVAIDISDDSNIRKIAEYIFGDANRDNTVNNIVLDTDNSIVICTTANADLLYDTINVLYFDLINESFALRKTFTEVNTINYSSIYLHNNYLYATNANSIDRQGGDTLRAAVGIHILKLSNNYQNIDKINNVPFGHYWNNTEMPLQFADRGYLPKLQHKYKEILTIDSNIAYVFVPKAGTAGTSSEHEDFLVMLSVSAPEQPTIVGTKSFYSTYDPPDEPLPQPIATAANVKYQVFILQEDVNNGIKYVIESNRATGFGEQFLISKVRTIDPSRISLMQEISLPNYMPYDTDYFNTRMSTVYTNVFNPATIIAIANGQDGIRTMYYDSQASEYKLLAQLRPQLISSSIYDDIYSVKIIGTNINNLRLIAIGKTNIYSYSYTGAGNTFSLLQTLPIAAYLGLPTDADLETRFAHFSNETSLFGTAIGVITLYPEHKVRT